MGKGTIISELGDGQYGVQLNFHRVHVDEKISELNSRISDLTAYIATLADGDEKTAAELLLTSYEKKKAYLQDNMPDDLTVKAWCADMTTGLTGEVGTIEVPGERGEVNIQPGYNGNAAYDIDRDGQLQPAIAGNPFNVLYNWCLLPAWQKWMPTYRYGTISNLSGDTCTVTLDDANSSQQDLDINRSSVFNDVVIEYMGCNGSAFSDGDEVLVEFVDQDPDNPKVIGFKESPRVCWSEPWGDTLTENHPWLYLFTEYNPYSTCSSIGCGGEASLSDGVLSFNYTADTNGENMRLRLNTTLMGGSAEPIVGTTKMKFKMSGGISDKKDYDEITLLLRFYDADDNYAGQCELFLDVGPGWYADNWFTDPCGTGGSSPSSPAYDLSGDNPLDGTEFEYNLTGICTYDVKIGQVYLYILLYEDSSVSLDFDYLVFN